MCVFVYVQQCYFTMQSCLLHCRWWPKQVQSVQCRDTVDKDDDKEGSVVAVVRHIRQVCKKSFSTPNRRVVEWKRRLLLLQGARRRGFRSELVGGVLQAAVILFSLCPASFIMPAVCLSEGHHHLTITTAEMPDTSDWTTGIPDNRIGVAEATNNVESANTSVLPQAYLSKSRLPIDTAAVMRRRLTQPTCADDSPPPVNTAETNGKLWSRTTTTTTRGVGRKGTAIGVGIYIWYIFLSSHRIGVKVGVSFVTVGMYLRCKTFHRRVGVDLVLVGVFILAYLGGVVCALGRLLLLAAARAPPLRVFPVPGFPPFGGFPPQPPPAPQRTDQEQHQGSSADPPPSYEACMDQRPINDNHNTPNAPQPHHTPPNAPQPHDTDDPPPSYDTFMRTLHANDYPPPPYTRIYSPAPRRRDKRRPDYPATICESDDED
eukprot:GHVQ01020265.1.p1 GENE.GHVQ01020265.1~~GHVQ01020265.1.p1  ORF type:complete len:431 (+),score=52.13 GHVQ01020265.1:430-1722(+)